jgi:hypothetical protein
MSSAPVAYLRRTVATGMARIGAAPYVVISFRALDLINY